MKVCPVCGGIRFLTKATVVQEWLVNGNDLCIKVTDDFVDVAKDVSDSNVWECYECGYRTKGKNFNVEE